MQYIAYKITKEQINDLYNIKEFKYTNTLKFLNLPIKYKSEYGYIIIKYNIPTIIVQAELKLFDSENNTIYNAIFDLNLAEQIIEKYKLIQDNTLI